MSEMGFMGVPLRELLIEAIHWEEEAIEHMEQRREEQGVRCPAPEEATEAALDPERVIRVASGGRSLKVVGSNRSTGGLIKVWL